MCDEEFLVGRTGLDDPREEGFGISSTLQLVQSLNETARARPHISVEAYRCVASVIQARHR